MVRCIVYAIESGSKEGLYFTDDMTSPASEFIPPGQTLSMEFEMDEPPMGFPLYYNFERN